MARALKPKIKSEFVTETEVENVIALRRLTEEKENELASIQKRLKEAEITVMDKLRDGLPVKSNLWVAALDIVTAPGKASPKWKEEYIAHFVAEHKGDREIIEKEMLVKYPAVPKDTTALVIAEKKEVA